ncbi:MAG: STAS domain-containing protein [Burkholderiales bacterium]
MPLKIQLQEGRPLTQTVALVGRLDTETAPSLDAEIDRLLASPVKVIVFELSGLDYISSAGLRSLFRAQKSMKARSGEALMVKPQPQVQKVFDIVKAVDVKSVFRDVAELDEYLDAMQNRVTGRK